MTEHRGEAAIQDLWRAIEQREDELVQTVADLVRRPSLLGREAEAQAYVADHLQRSGLAVDVWELDDAITSPEIRPALSRSWRARAEGGRSS